MDNNVNQQITEQTQPSQIIEQAQPAVQQPVVYDQQSQQVQYIQPAFVSQPAAQQPAANPNRGKGLAMSIIGMILGITALYEFISFAGSSLSFFALLPMLVSFLESYSPDLSEIYSGLYDTGAFPMMTNAVSPIITAVAGITLSALGKKRNGSKMAKAGLIMSIIALAGTLLVSAVVAVTEFI